MDAYGGMEMRRHESLLGSFDGESNKAFGRAETAGVVKCPLCSSRRQKRFCRGRGLQMHFASAHRDLDEATLARALSDAEASREERVPKGALPEACRAARDGDAEKLASLHRSGRWRPLDPAHRDKHGYRAHHWAAGSASGCLEACLLMASATEIDELTASERREGKRGGRTLLHWAARNGIEKHVELLCAMTPVDSRTADGTTPLMLALYAGHLTVADALLRHGASRRCENEWGCTCAHWAAMGEDPMRTLPWLLAVGSLEETSMGPSDMVTSQVHGHTAFHKLAQRGHASTALFLCTLLDGETKMLDRGLRPDAGGRRPSEIAACAGYDDAASVLRRLEGKVEEAAYVGSCRVTI